MKKKDLVEGIIEKTAFPNVGIMNVDGKKVHIKGTLEGQLVKAQIQKARKNKIEGRLTEIIKPSPLETETDICPAFGQCGGCFYSSIPYERELKIKEEQIRSLLSPYVGEEEYRKVYKGILSSPSEEGYRNKMEFTFGDEYKGGPLALGLHKKSAFHDIITASDCRIADEDFTAILNSTLGFFSEKEIPFYHRMSHEGILRHLLIRKGAFTGEILVDLVTTSGLDRDIAHEWCRHIKGIPVKGKYAGILHTVNDNVADTVEDGGTEVLSGDPGFTEKLLSLSFYITPFSFFQTNSGGAEVLYETVSSLVTECGTVYDLYSGTGTIAQVISKKAGKVIGVEIVPEAVEAAVENAGKNKITNVQFLCGDVLKVLDSISELPDSIILDPPRDGIHPKALSRILSYGVESIIYVSCKPTSLARDLEAFGENGYRPDFIKLVDMFPRTANVETIVRFIK